MLTVGDTVTTKDGNKLTISGVLTDTMHSHGSVVMMSDAGFESLNNLSVTIYQLLIYQIINTTVRNISGVNIYSEQDITDEIPVIKLNKHH